jgi:aromatic ring-opening dioxygenase catalytic subunit (LigB family)
MVRTFATLRPLLPPRPRAIVVISAHWETTTWTIQSTPQPNMIYDYYGFPPQSYQYSYPAPGAPALAQEIAILLENAGLPHAEDSTRGYDHGSFVPLMLLYPEADIPVLEISLNANLDPAAHFSLGAALRPLRENGVLIIGSGYTFHNLPALRHSSAEVQQKSAAFTHWLDQTLHHDTTLSADARKERLCHWQAAPHARYAHPREEHLLPLHVCAGVANTRPDTIQKYTILDLPARNYIWGDHTAASQQKEAVPF